jgi:uncharacterized protein (TIGR02145 family)
MKQLSMILIVICIIGCGKKKSVDSNTMIGMNLKGIVKDIDGNVYPTVTIGKQVWMAENLKTTKYNDGTSIPLVTEKLAWEALKKPAYCWFNNDSSNISIYGTLYNWYTVKTNKLCPIGWHVPTAKEWVILITYLGGKKVAGGKLKEEGLTHWQSPNKGASNETDFTALPGGERRKDGTFCRIGYDGYWWSSTEQDTSTANYRCLLTIFSKVGFGVRSFKQNGFSVRCLKDN